MSTDSIILTAPFSDNNTLRLNFIAGRYLSEQEFDLMQEYVDQRCQDLLLTQTPGIVRGLDVHLSQKVNDETIQINPGLGISWSSRSVGVRIPVWFYWQDLLDNYKSEQKIKGNLANGFYFLTVRRKVEILDEVTESDPFARTEPDPLRDSRLETLAQVNLQPIVLASTVFSFSRQKACMRILKHMLSPTEQAENPHEIKVALVKVTDQKIDWIDLQAGRFLAQENSIYQALLNYWHLILRSPNQFRLDGPGVTLNSAASLHDLLDLDYLPAAGKFPNQLITQLAGKQNAGDSSVWDRPILQFNSEDLQIEIVPVPANSVNGVIQKELPRGLVDLLNGEADRIRLMVAVDPDSYDPKLMDLPDYDHQLLQDLCDREKTATEAYKSWALSFYQLYENLDAEISFNVDGKTPTDDTLNLLSSTYFSKIPELAFALIDSDDKWKALKLPNKEPAPITVQNFLLSLRRTRLQQLNPRRIVPYILIRYPAGTIPADASLPRPYSLAVNFDPDDVYTDNRNHSDGLFEQRVQLKKDLEKIKNYLETLNSLIDETRDYLSHHRQQLDSVTVSFSSLAGGVPGDGTGLKLMRWADQLTFTTNK